MDGNVYEEAKRIAAQMTPEEMASLCSGADFWHLKPVPRVGLTESLLMTDGPHGLRKQTGEADQLGLGESVPATCFPAACLTACSFDRALISQMGRAIGEECRAEGVSVVLGPGVNIKRSPLCGRNFEYFSEDPLLAGELAAAFIQGVQSQHVGTSLKHFACNNQEKLRMTIDAVVDERALRELYLAAFEIAVKKAQPWTVMCAYNRVNGVYAGDNRRLLTDILRGEWGFEGLVVSDWGAVNDRVAGVRAGMDLEMPGVSRANDKKVLAACKSGALSPEELETDAARVTALMLKARAREDFTYDIEAHHALARRIAANAAVLLKNDGDVLPLAPGADIAVIGAFALSPRYQGAGSSKIHPHRVDSAIDALEDAGLRVAYAPGYSLTHNAPDEALIEEACAAARDKDAAVIFAGLPDRDESEGFDRTTLAMPEAHVRLIERVAAVNPMTVVVLQCGAVVSCPWADGVAGILLAYLGGEAGCGATADILTGRVNPSGKLAESWCYALSDNPSYACFPGYARSVEYRESVFVGYRYYDTAGKAVRYPFGYGLSYTHFGYTGLALEKDSLSDADTLELSFTLTNDGARAGAEAVQLYVAPQTAEGPFRPVQELRAFDKIFLEPGEAKRVRFTLDARAFAYYHAGARDWAVQSGAYEIRIGASSRDIRLSGVVQVRAIRPLAVPELRAKAPCYYELSGGMNVPEEAFEKLLDRPLPPREMAANEAHTINSTMREIKNRALGRLIAGAALKVASAMFKGDEGMRLMTENMLSDAPLRTMLMAGGMVTPQRLDALVAMLNRRPLAALRALLGRAKP